ncbi:hypothetical protein PG984_007056 [Apiospora sp. TS-2023a]
MQYSSLPIALLLSLLAAGTHAIPTTNGVQAQPPRGLLPGSTSQAPRKRGYPLQPNPPNDLYNSYDCTPNFTLDPKETAEAKGKLMDQINRGVPVPNYGCLSGKCGGSIAFYCAGRTDGATIVAPQSDMPKVWKALVHKCGEDNMSLVGVNDPYNVWAAGFLPSEADYELEHGSLLTMSVG